MNELKRQFWLKWLLPVITLAFALVGVWTAQGGRNEHVARPLVLSSTQPVSQQRCAECHFEITDGYETAPHARTLMQVRSAEDAQPFVGRVFRREDTGVEFRYAWKNDQLMVSSPAYARELPIEWIFGSGTHARTPLITWTNQQGNTSGLEHSVSWYPDGELGPTLGMENSQETTGVLALGLPRSPSETINCFGCHSTHMPMDNGEIVFHGIDTGIGCARCHWDTDTHVHEMDYGLASTIERFSQLSPLESVDRCGECHRRADEMEGKIDPSDKTLVRFASVGLVQSPCFQRQAEVKLPAGETARLDCTTCHNPHRPTSRDWRVHVQQCLKCHDATQDRAADCTVASRNTNCLNCHMPQIPENQHLQFTDHWIRIRSETIQN